MIVFNRIFPVIVFLALCIGNAASAQEPEITSSESRKDVMTDALYFDAIKARMLRNDKQEEELLRQVLRQKPAEAAPYFDLAKLYLKQSKVDQAEQYILKAIDLNKENSWYKKLYAEVLVLQSKPEVAANIYREIAASEQYNSDYLLLAAKYYESAGKLKESQEMLDKLVKKVGPDEELLIQKQQLFLRMNDLDGAVKIAEQLISLNPNEGRYYANLADLYNNNGKPEKAIEIYEKALKDFPGDATIQFGLATYYKKNNNEEKFDEYIRKAILNPEFDEETQVNILLNYLQEINADSSKRQEGVELTEQLVHQHPHNADIKALYAQVLLNDQQTDKAAEQLKTVLELTPSRFNVWQQLLFCYTAPAYADSLVKYSEKAMRYFPNQSMIHYLNGIGNFNKKNYPAAIKSVNRAIDLQPEESKSLLADMYSSLGEIYNATKQYPLSDSSYEKSLRLNPDNASVLNNYSYYLSLRGQRLDDAARMSKRSLELQPGEPTFLDTYGWILYKQRKFAEAKKYIEDALKGMPNADGTLWEHLGDVYYQMKDVDKAVEYWMKAREKNTENPQIDKKIQDKKLYE